MLPLVAPAATIEVRRVFQAWSIAVPSSFEETFVAEDHYWHAWDESRSVSLTSIVVTKGRRSVTAERLLREIPAMPGAAIDEFPPGLRGHAAVGPTSPPARASSALGGVLAVDGRLLIVTITSDELDWARATWLSIRHLPAPIQSPTKARPRRAGRQRR